jgi:hypothetical protein
MDDEPWDHAVNEGEQMAYDETFIDLDQGERETNERGGMVRAAAARALRWGEVLRTRGRTNSPGRHAVGAAASSVEADVADLEAAHNDEQRRHDLPNGESPYIYTAT